MLKLCLSVILTAPHLLDLILKQRLRRHHLVSERQLLMINFMLTVKFSNNTCRNFKRSCSSLKPFKHLLGYLLHQPFYILECMAVITVLVGCSPKNESFRSNLNFFITCVGPFQFPHAVSQKSSELARTATDSVAGVNSWTDTVSESAARFTGKSLERLMVSLRCWVSHTCDHFAVSQVRSHFERNFDSATNLASKSVKVIV
jgi:hypothetical protein